MPQAGEIKSEKILVKDIFSRMWFRIPEYQRPYVWGREEVNDLLDDLAFAMQEKPESEYFLGSFVFQARAAAPEKGQEFDENDLLDGQQRMTTLLLLLAVIRDLATDPDAKDDCQKCIYQKASKYKNIPERTRLVFAIREAVQKFVESRINTEGGTSAEAELIKLSEKNEDLSVQNIANAILEIHKFFKRNPGFKAEDLLQFLLNKVLMIYVSTEDLEDAFRLFMILNDRGIPLRNSDILKSMNLGALESSGEKIKYAKMWEEAEGELGEDFDRFLSHVRTILVKDKARLSLLQEYEDRIYDPKERDKATGKKKPALLVKGQETFKLIERYLNHYKLLLGGQNHDETGSYEFDNLIKVMLSGLPATDWVPPMIRYFDKFKHDRLLDFLKALDNKFAGDWLGQYTPTDRIEAMNNVIKVIEEAASPVEVFSSDCLTFDVDSFHRTLEGPVYGKRFARYILLKLDHLYHDHALRMHFETLSIEHILPQNPADSSQWVKDFSVDDRAEWTDKLGNLVLITGRKNSSQGRMDYREKKEKYFEKCIDTCPNSLRVLNQNQEWKLPELKKNQLVVEQKLLEQAGVADSEVRRLLHKS